MVPLSYRGHDRLFFWRPAGDADEIICRVAILHRLRPPPLLEVDRGR